MKEVKYPILFSWNIKEDNVISYWISKTGNDKIMQPISGNGSMRLNSSDEGDLIVIAQAAGPCHPVVQKTTPQEKEIRGHTLLPAENSMEQNIPNPYNSATVIRYSLREDSRVVLKVYNILGEEVRILVDKIETAGYKEVNFDANNLPSGVYYYKIQAGDFVDVKKMLLVR